MVPWIVSFLYNQLFMRTPEPTQSFQDKIVIATGANTGLGLEAAKHFVRLDARKLSFRAGMSRTAKQQSEP